MAKTKAKAKKTKKPKVSVVINSTFKAHWQKALDQFRRARADETTSWDERYEALGEILDQQLYLAGGFRSASAFLRAETPELSERTARQYVRVARFFEPEDEVVHGIAKLDALLEYLSAQGGGELKSAKIDLGRQKVRVADGKKVRVISFAEASRDDLRRATRSVKGRTGKTAAKLSPLVKALKQVASRAGAASIGVRLVRQKIDLTGIPPDRLATLGRELGKAKLPLDS